MVALGPVDAARLTSLATGRGGVPTAEEWPIVLALLALIAIVGARVLVAVGLTRVEALLVCALAPLLVVFDAPLGKLSPTVHLAANLAGCLIPSAVAVKIFLERRVPFAEGALLIGIAIVVSYFSSHVDPDRGVLLQYRIPSVVIALLSAGLLYRVRDDVPAGAAGAGGFAAGALGVVIGADLLHLQELATGAGSGRVILGGAGLLDGILLVALLSAALAELVACGLRAIVRVRVPKPAV